MVLIVNKLSQNLAQKRRTKGDVGQCDLDLGSSHYITAGTGLPHRSLVEKYPNQPDMLDAINTLLKVNRVSLSLLRPPTLVNH